jgi:hypothetical protein
VGSPGAARDENGEQLNFTASVTDHDGGPVENLDMKDFNLRAFIVGPGGPPTDLTSAAEATKGVDLLTVVPRRPWALGTYLFVLTIEKGHDRGQTVIPLTIPE